MRTTWTQESCLMKQGHVTLRKKNGLRKTINTYEVAILTEEERSYNLEHRELVMHIGKKEIEKPWNKVKC